MSVEFVKKNVKMKISCFKSLLLFACFGWILLLFSCSNDADSLISGSGIFQSQIANGMIEGELFLPDGPGPFPLMIVVPGSGLGSREESRPFIQIFDSIKYATYIYDKRGIGGSTGRYPEEDSDGTEFLTARAEDVLAIIETLKWHLDIDFSRIGLIGSSQGTWVSSIVCEKSPDIALMVMTNGGAIPTQFEFFYDTLLQNNPDLTVEEGHDELSNYNGETGFDPRSIFRQMDVPVLFILGGQDRSHPTLWELDFINSLGNHNFEIHFYPNANHEMEDVDTGELPADMIPRLLDWLVRNG